MKTMFFIFVLLISVLEINGQRSLFDDMFRKYSNQEGIVSINLPKFKMIALENKDMNSHYNFYKDLMPRINKHHYEELMAVNEKDHQISILARTKNGKMVEFIMIVGGEDNFAMSIEGELDPSNFDEISKHLKPDEIKKFKKNCHIKLDWE